MWSIHTTGYDATLKEEGDADTCYEMYEPGRQHTQ